MLGMKLVRLIERHSEALSRELVDEIRNSERTSDFRNLSPENLRRAAAELYHNLGEWLLQKTEPDIAGRFKAIGARRAAEGVRLHQFLWALMLTRDHLWYFLRREAFADTIVQLHGELELNTLLNQFFDRAIYYAVLGYEEAGGPGTPRGELRRIQDLATAIGLMEERAQPSEMMEE
ncbi:MAG TPA: hypothetical protein VGS05_12065 [Candidatus Sulfotelmatobacter sp.]|nr:hypothetical protein [Candidatus Sulfotelmatobacter sp.]